MKKNQKRFKVMAKHTVFMDRKTQHSKNVNSPKLIHNFNTIAIKIPEMFFVDKIILKFVRKGKEENS